MNKKVFALLVSAVMLCSLTACKKSASTEPTTAPATEPTTVPSKSEPVQLLSHVQWLADGDVGEVDCQYNEKTNTLNITGDGFYPVEVLFFEGAQQVQKQTVWDDEGLVFSQQEYDQDGKLLYEQDVYGYHRFYEYDGNLLIKETVYEDGDQLYSVKEWTYDDAGQEVRYSEETENGEASQNIRHSYDEEGNLIFYRLDSTYGDNAWYQEEAYTYTDGRLTASTHEGDDPVTSWDYTMIYYYDDLGRKVGALRQDADHGEAEDVFEYDDNGRLIRSSEHYQMDGWVEALHEYTYDDAGRLVWEHYEESYLSDGELFFWHTTTYVYDSDGKVTEILYNSSDAELRVHYNMYDSQGNLIQSCDMIDGEEILLETYTYDADHNLVSISIDGTEVLKGEEIQFVSGENESDRYLVTQYGDTAEAQEATAVNQFILQYIRTHF